MCALLKAAGTGEPLPPPRRDDGERRAGVLTNANANSHAGARPGRPPTNKRDGAQQRPPTAEGEEEVEEGESSPSFGGAVVAASQGPPPTPRHPLGDATALPTSITRSTLLDELQTLLNSRETDMKQLLVRPSGLKHEVQCDVVRTHSRCNSYRCYLRLGGTSDRRLCIFEATRSRKGKLKNSEYKIMLPAQDPRLVDASGVGDKELEARLYCGKVRSYNLSGANFVAYDDGDKVEQPISERPSVGRPRRQMVAMTFNKSTSRRVPMTMRMLVPTPEAAAEPEGASQLLDTLQAMPLEDSGGSPPEGTRLLKLVPPRWNADEQMFQLFCEGRACAMSNKNVQLADTTLPDEAALQVGKLSESMFNVDLQGVLSPFQAFCSALAVFDQSSVRRRF